MKLPFPKSFWIEPGKIIGGRYPGTKAPDESRKMLDDLLATGVRTIVNLQELDERGRGGSLFPDYQPVIAELAKSRDVEVAFYRFPIPDLGIPDSEIMADIQATLQKAVDAGKLVYIHCWGGHGRTGTVAGCWLVDRGATPAEAINLIKERRGHDSHLARNPAPQTPEQRKMIETWHAAQPKPAKHPAHPKPKGLTTTIVTNHDSAVGALLGLAVGDAVGTTLEFKLPGSFEPLTDMVGGGPFHLQAGEWADDTSMALCLAESLSELGFFEPVDQLKRYVRWWKEGHFSVKGYCFDIGNQVTAALSDFLSSGNSYCGPAGPYNAGNGSLMRLAPVAMAFAGSPSAAISYAAQSSRTTHQNLECVDSCRYFAGLLVGAMQGERKEKILGSMYSPIPGLWNREPLQPKVITIASGSFKTRQPPKIKGTGYVIDCLEAALWAFHGTDSFEEAVLRAANLGDDADTTATVCGQIAGAYYGLSAIPTKWLEKLAQRDVITGLAEALVQLSAIKTS